MVAVFCSALYGHRKTTVFLFHVLQTMVNRHIPCMLVPDTVWLSRPCCSFFSYRISVDKKRDFYFPIVSVDHCCRVVLTCHFLMPGYKPQRATSGFAIVRGDEQMLYFSISVLSLVQNSSDGSLWPHHRKAAGRCTQYLDSFCARHLHLLPAVICFPVDSKHE